MMRTIFISVILMCVPILYVNAQLEQEVRDFNNIFSPSPDMKEFATVDDLPIDHFTGKANISIPLFNLKSRELSIDISASYNMETLKVSQRSGTIGYNWNLNLPYKVTRNIVGKADEGPLGYFEMAQNLPEDINDIYLDPNYFSYEHRKEIVNGKVDYEPDIFSFSLPGISGQFVFHVAQDTTIHTIPHQNIRIQTNPSLSYFLITTTDGTVFHFGEWNGQNNVEITNYETRDGGTSVMSSIN